MSKVSLLTPIYNGEDYLENWAKYLLRQSYDDVEVIAINDGSEDNTECLLEDMKHRFIERGYSFIIITQSNQGAAGAINSGLKRVSGDYIMLYDCDDIIMRDAIKEKADFLDKNPSYGMVRNNGYHVKAKNLKQNSYLFVRKAKEKENEHIFEDILYGRTNNWTATFMIRSECLWRSLGGRDIYISPWGQNMQLMLPVSYYYKSGFIDKPLMRYVDYGRGVSRTHNFEDGCMMFKGYEENRLEIIKRMDIPDEKKKEYANKINTMYLHILLGAAAEFQESDEAKKLYSELNSQKNVHITDRVNYAASRSRVFSKFLKRYRYLIKMFGCVYFKAEGMLFRHDEIC